MWDNSASASTAFRAEVAAWVAANFPPVLRTRDPQRYVTDGGYADADPDFQLWLRRVVDKGWGAPTWPLAYGGAGMSADEAAIIHQEMARIGAFHPNRTYGVMMLAPTLLELGDEWQKQRFVPPIARGEERWCQGFSEPGAGSDLASLQTKCVDGGDCWIVTGQKIWTSGANHAHWCFCLVRTDTQAKQGGISFLLIDMKSPGVEARPIQLISGSTHFCEVFFNDVRVPKTHMVGDVNRGWTVAKRLLQFERDSLANNNVTDESLAPIARDYLGVDEAGRIADADVRARIVRHAVRARAFAHTLRRSALGPDSNQPGVPVSVLKNLGAGLDQERHELIVEIMGQRALGWDGEGYESAELAAARSWLYSKARSVYGGSHEIQNNITAKRVLGLPSDS